MGWDLAYKVFEPQFKRFLSFVESENSRYLGTQDKLDSLRDNMDKINNLLMEVEEKNNIQDLTVRNWLCQLKRVSFDSDNLLDSHQTALHLYEANMADPSISDDEEPSRKRKRSLRDIPVFLHSLGPRWGPLQRRKLGLEIDSIMKRFGDLENRRPARPDSEGTRRIQFFQTEASKNLNPKVTRETLKNEIVVILTDDLREAGPMRTVPVVAIWGGADIGKTKLAQLVYDDDRIRRYFHLKVWVSLTNMCDEISAMKRIFKKITNQSCDLDSMDTIQNRLRMHLGSIQRNKILLVIDNVCEEGLWGVLGGPLLSGGKGSKVLITTRSETVNKYMSPLLHLTNLNRLGEEECWDVLESFILAAGVGGLSNQLVQIGMEIANRCYGSPLAAKTVGAILRGLDLREEDWSNILHKMQASRAENNAILPGLIVCYRALPYHIKQCFTYCCVLPEGYLFEKDQVIRYWMAEGLIEVRSPVDMEDLGEEYFNELIGRSFFEKFNANDKIERKMYIIPSLMHNMVRLISHYEFLDLNYDGSPRLVNEQGRGRYASLFYKVGQPFRIENAYNFGNLRTLILCGQLSVCVETIPQELFAKLLCLRVLDFSNSNLIELPSIAKNQLRHLRYLGLSNTPIKKLPESVCQLYNLQTMDLGGCTSLVKLPDRLSKLVNLRHLTYHINWDKITNKNSFCMPRGIRKLTSLRTLSRFTISLDSNGKSNLCELGGLNQIKGQLCISNLDKLTDEQDARDANLSKKRLEKLMLRWSDGCMKEYPMDWVRVVAHELQPHSSLKCLWIVNYPDSELPNWVGNPAFTMLETVRLSNLTFMPSLGMLPGLKHLYVEKLSLEIMDTLAGFPSLETLTITNMAELNKVCQTQHIPSLQKLNVSNCPNLNELEIHPDLGLIMLEIQNCPNYGV